MTSDSGWNLEKAIKEILNFRSDREWKKFHKPKELAAAIAIESAELQELFLWRGEETVEEIRGDPARFQKIKEEISDIVIYLLFFANDLKINLAEAIIEKNKENSIRYPIDKNLGEYAKPV